MIHFLLALLCPSEAPTPDQAIVHALRLGENAAIHVDGRLDEPAWREAAPASSFRQREPAAGTLASEDTEVRVLFDARTLYVGVLARDREPDKVIGRLLQRDRVMEVGGFDNRHVFAGDDGVAILLDPFHDRKNAVVFATNPNGAEFDALITDENGTFNADWRGIWSVRAARLAEGWSAEFAIPFRSLRYPQSGGAWGFNAYRVIRRRNEEVLWTSWSREAGFHRVSQAGELRGLEGLPRGGLDLDLKPYTLTGASLDREEGSGTTEGRLEVGLDAKWEVRPGLVLDATLHPDFAQVEADDQQVNLTRFDLFFPEKRDFFLENAGVFDFGARGFGEPPPFLLFFSRQIGIVEDGEVPVQGGVRLSGRVGRQTVGFLDVVTAPALGEPGRNYGILRVKRDVGARNYVGAIVTDRRSADDWNTAGGVDWSFWPKSSLNVQGFFARTGTAGPGGDGSAYRLFADYTGDKRGFFVQHVAIGPEATADMGFITRTDIRRSDALGRATFRPSVAGLRKLDLFAGVNHVLNTRGERQDVNIGPAVGAEWEGGESMLFVFGGGSTRVDESFDLSDRVTVPIGDYDLRYVFLTGSSSRNRPLVASADVSLQRTFGGTVDTYGARLSLAGGSHLSLGLGVTRNRVDLPWGRFTADLASLRASYAFSTRLALYSLVQYNSLEKQLLTNLRLSFIHRPGSDLFVVFNEERGDGTTLGNVRNRALIIKMTYLARL